MSKINLTIDTDDLLSTWEMDAETGPTGEQGAPLQQLVIEAAARQIVRGENFDREVREAVRLQIKEETESQVAAMVTEAIRQPFDITTPWGEKSREGVTVRELIRENVESWFKPARRNNGSYSAATQDRDTLAYLVTEVAKTVMDKELKTEVDRVRKEVGNDIRDKALRAAVDAISPRI